MLSENNIHNKINEHIGAKILKYRTNKNMTQAQLAEKTDTTSKFVSQLENGKTGIKIDTFIKYCYKIFLRKRRSSVPPSGGIRYPFEAVAFVTFDKKLPKIYTAFPLRPVREYAILNLFLRLGGANFAETYPHPAGPDAAAQ